MQPHRRCASMITSMCRCRWPPRMVRHMSDFLQHKVCGSLPPDLLLTTISLSLTSRKPHASSL